MPEPISTTPAQEPPKPEETTPESLHDAAIAATEAWQTDPTPEAKEAAVAAVAKAKDALKGLSKKPVVPEKYDLKPKEGSTIDAAHLEKISAFAKAKGLSNEDAQALLDRDQENFSAITAAQSAEVQKIKESWLPASQADKEIGGEGFTKNVELARRVISRVGSDEFKKFLDSTGFGNHPEVVRVFYRLGKMMTEDQLVVGTTAPPSVVKKSTADVLHPTTVES